MNLTAIISVMSVFIGTPLVVFSFIYLNVRSKRNIEALRYRKEIIELELEKEQIKLKVIEEENKKYDKLIETESQ